MSPDSPAQTTSTTPPCPSPNPHDPYQHTAVIHLTFEPADWNALSFLAQTLRSTPSDLIHLSLSELLSIANRAHAASKEPASCPPL